MLNPGQILSMGGVRQRVIGEKWGNFPAAERDQREKNSTIRESRRLLKGNGKERINENWGKKGKKKR